MTKLVRSTMGTVTLLAVINCGSESRTNDGGNDGEVKATDSGVLSSASLPLKGDGPVVTGLFLTCYGSMIEIRTIAGHQDVNYDGTITVMARIKDPGSDKVETGGVLIKKVDFGSIVKSPDEVFRGDDFKLSRSKICSAKTWAVEVSATDAQGHITKRTAPAQIIN